MSEKEISAINKIIPHDYKSKYDVFHLNIPGCVSGMDPCQTFL